MIEQLPPPYATTPEDLYRWQIGLPVRSRWIEEPWRSWIAWRPVRASGRWVWCRIIGRRRLWERRPRFTPFGVYFRTKVEFRLRPGP